MASRRGRSQRRFTRLLPPLLLLLLIALLQPQSCTAQPSGLPVLPLNLTALLINAASPAYSGLLSSLSETAREALSSPLHNISSSPLLPSLPPNSSPQYYFSFSPYWWPAASCDTSASPAYMLSCPYEYRDGQVNTRDVEQSGSMSAFRALTSDVVALVLTGTVMAARGQGGSEAFGAKAAQQLQSFFLDPESRMLPNLVYAQAVVGNNSRPITGTPAGITDMDALPLLLQSSALLLSLNASWTMQQHAQLLDWAAQLSSYLSSSLQGQQAKQSASYLSSWWACQQLATQAALNDSSAFNSTLSAWLTEQYDRQWNTSGAPSAPVDSLSWWLEAVRNAEGLDCIAAYAALSGVDLYHTANAHNSTLRDAAQWLLSSRPASDSALRRLAPLLSHVLTVYGDDGNSSLSCLLAPVINASSPAFAPSYYPLYTTRVTGEGVNSSMLVCPDAGGSGGGGGLLDGLSFTTQAVVVVALVAIVVAAISVCMWRTRDEGKQAAGTADGEQAADEDEEEEEEDDEDEAEEETEEYDDGVRLTHSRDSSMVSSSNADLNVVLLGSEQVDDATLVQQRGRHQRRKTRGNGVVQDAPSI